MLFYMFNAHYLIKYHLDIRYLNGRMIRIIRIKTYTYWELGTHKKQIMENSNSSILVPVSSAWPHISTQ